MTPRSPIPTTPPRRSSRIQCKKSQELIDKGEVTGRIYSNIVPHHDLWCNGQYNYYLLINTLTKMGLYNHSIADGLVLTVTSRPRDFLDMHTWVASGGWRYILQNTFSLDSACVQQDLSVACKERLTGKRCYEEAQSLP
ncbi:hypothetical protein Pcinc_033223 [Petrolisthes cinctipes]|uniref:Uncharacterized protein n=1 Tax=Petrolisthes cinctipes TaxID=88211 RepID=A0AAE1K1T2_PETCI|nr:hypothetical protein Pcinc_033223 [Petrolisthes cinctipes]